LHKITNKVRECWEHAAFFDLNHIANNKKQLQMIKQITPCLWFDNQAGEAAKFYTSVFKNSKIDHTSYYGNEGANGQKEDRILTVAFQLNGQSFTALNGGPVFKFNEAISFQVSCDTQEEIDYFWDALSKEGTESQCGWLKDKFGVSWQIIPSILGKLMSDREKAPRVMKEFMKMKKFDIEKLINA
jgi:predicted 3-demethylubiquinone-9 3-methyltransferase (glyoxalase superfamily)